MINEFDSSLQVTTTVRLGTQKETVKSSDIDFVPVPYSTVKLQLHYITVQYITIMFMYSTSSDIDFVPVALEKA